MPNSLVHLKIGYEIAKKYTMLDKPKYYIGLITPDAVNLYGFAEKSKRWRAHVRAENLDVWEEQILDFYKQNEEKYEKIYLVGYLIHVLTDIVFDRIYGNEIINQIHKIGIYEDEFGFYHQELKKYEFSQIQENWWKEVIENLKEAKAVSINSMEAEEINHWRDKKIEEYEGKEVTGYGMIKNDLIEKAKLEVEKILIKNNIL